VLGVNSSEENELGEDPSLRLFPVIMGNTLDQLGLIDLVSFSASKHRKGWIHGNVLPRKLFLATINNAVEIWPSEF
jgi:hypothetical protein